MVKSLFPILLITFCASVFGKNPDTRNADELHAQLSAIAAKGERRNIDDLYVVLLKDSALVTYQTNTSALSGKGLLSGGQSSVKLDVNSVASKRYLTTLAAKQERIVNSISAKLKRDVKTGFRYKYSLNGFTTKLSTHEIDSIKELDDVAQVIKLQEKYIATDSGPGIIQAPSVWQGVKGSIASKGEGAVVAVFDTGINAKHRSFAALGDDGYEHNNPLGTGNYLGDCALSQYVQFCNDKLIGIYSYSEITKTVPGSRLPIGIDYNGHGSHTASTAAGNILNDVPYYYRRGDITHLRAKKSALEFEQISGVAPHANIISYQVCTPTGYCYEDLTLKAIESAIKNGVDVINYSVGGGFQSPWHSAEALAFLNARQAGIHVAVSAGNYGPFTHSVSSPANSPWLTSVAASVVGRTISGSKRINVYRDGVEIGMFSGNAISNGISGDLISAEKYNNKYCTDMWPENRFAGEIVVCTYLQGSRLAISEMLLTAGAAGVVFINDESLNSDDTPETLHAIPGININKSKGNALLALLNNNDELKAEISKSNIWYDLSYENHRAWFSSRGPELNYNQYLSPNITAPGHGIYAAFSEDVYYVTEPFLGYDINIDAPFTNMSGTSMSAPHIAGAYALLSQVKPEWTPAQAQSALMLTADANTLMEGGSNKTNYYDTGAGIARLNAALRTGLIMDVNINDYRNAAPSATRDAISLNLPAMVHEECQNTCFWHRTFTATKDANWTVKLNNNSEGVSLKVIPMQFTLVAGQSITIDVQAMITKSYDGGFNFSNIDLIPDNTDLSPNSVPIISSFMLAEKPKTIEISTGKDASHASVSNIRLFNHTKLNINELEAMPLTKVSTTLKRDLGDSAPWPENVFNDAQYLYQQSFTVDDETRFITFKVTKTSAEDLDMYIGIDSNNSGSVDSIEEIINADCISFSNNNADVCTLRDPKPGQYYVAIHNYGSPLETDLTIEDSLSIEYIILKDGEGAITTEYKPNITFYEDIGLIVKWDQAFEEADTVYSVLELKSGNSQNKDLGYIWLKLNKSESIVSTKVDKTEYDAGEFINYQLLLADNNTTEERTITMDLSLNSDLTVTSSELNYRPLDNLYRFTVTQHANEPGKAYKVVIATKAKMKTNSYSLNLDYKVENISYQQVIDSIEILGEPVARIENKEKESFIINEQSQLVISTTGSEAGDGVSSLQYQWQQISGPTLEFESNDRNELVISTPSINAEQQAVMSLTVSDGRRTSTPATATLYLKDSIKPSSSSGGGLLWLSVLMLLALPCNRLKALINHS